jgi:DNA-binding transcriptional regulator YhcF (GntR family)
MRHPRSDAKGYAFIVEFFTKNCKMPSYQKIADHMQYVSKRSVSLMLQRLTEEGYVKLVNGEISFVRDGDANQAMHNAQSLIHNIAVHVGQMAYHEYENRS